MKILDGELWIDLWTLSWTTHSNHRLEISLEGDKSGLNIQGIQELHKQSSPAEKLPRYFILALASLCVDLVQKSQGIEICSTPIEELLEAMYAQMEPNSSFDFELPSASGRKRLGETTNSTVEPDIGVMTEMDGNTQFIYPVTHHGSYRASFKVLQSMDL